MLQSEIFERCGFNPNPSQRQAIQYTKGPLLIIAGPGSGKTEVLIHRTLNLLLPHDVDPRTFSSALLRRRRPNNSKHV